ncbi:MarR family winged helix-turn-helix transcriptional regulator [Glycomyces artemisiae]|uniref:DNA-binding MarR family transcriptional regulator n=1 Tax=Glycomyces artemisiae TaxID=1076443 RepID=A0A2T0U833_9ACTN|nr:MarR family transcriptional regulator [Glycomyces artemisiae]PRY54074.1 DNA-binding MarR family transcriptional regulator [Glycomyces artemisiae]
MEDYAGEPAEIGSALVRTSFLVDAVYADAARQFDLTTAQSQLLCIILPRPFGMFELAKALGLAKSSITGLVDRCERRDLVRREAVPGDGRASLVTLTPKGAQLAEELHEVILKRTAELTAGLDDTERDTLLGLLARVVTGNRAPSAADEGACPSAEC